MRSLKMRELKMRVLKMRSRKMRVRKMRVRKMRSLKMRVRKIRVRKMRSLKMRVRKIRSLKIRKSFDASFDSRFEIPIKIEHWLISVSIFDDSHFTNPFLRVSERCIFIDKMTGLAIVVCGIRLGKSAISTLHVVSLTSSRYCHRSRLSSPAACRSALRSWSCSILRAAS
jgi:hypothetical protein